MSQTLYSHVVVEQEVKEEEAPVVEEVKVQEENREESQDQPEIAQNE